VAGCSSGCPQYHDRQICEALASPVSAAESAGRITQMGCRSDARARSGTPPGIPIGAHGQRPEGSDEGSARPTILRHIGSASRHVAPKQTRRWGAWGSAVKRAFAARHSVLTLRWSFAAGVTDRCGLGPRREVPDDHHHFICFICRIGPGRAGVLRSGEAGVNRVPGRVLRPDPRGIRAGLAPVHCLVPPPAAAPVRRPPGRHRTVRP
jgi:hypothetical protein